MAEVTGKTSIKIDELVNSTVVSGRVQDGNLILVTRGGAEVLAGFIGYGTTTDPGGGPPNPDEDDGTLVTYENAAPNSLFAIHRDSLTLDWPAQRPSSRNDIYFDVTGPEPSPSWMLANDRRSIPMGENGMPIALEDLVVDTGGGGGLAGPQTYETAMPTTMFVIYRDAVTGNWPSVRPSARADIVFDVTGIDPSPNWMIDRDRRTLLKP